MSQGIDVDCELMNEANIPGIYRSLPRRDEIPGHEIIEEYFKPIIDYTVVPYENIYVWSNDHDFASRVVSKIIAGFIGRKVVCYCTMANLIKDQMDENRGILIEPRILGVYLLGSEAANDFDKSLEAISSMISYRATKGLSTVFSSVMSPEEVTKAYKQPIPSFIMKNCLVLDVRKTP